MARKKNKTERRSHSDNDLFEQFRGLGAKGNGNDFLWMGERQCSEGLSYWPIQCKFIRNVLKWKYYGEDVDSPTPEELDTWVIDPGWRDPYCPE